MYGLVIEEGLRGEDFYRERHRLIYEAMLALYRDNEPIDVLTVVRAPAKQTDAWRRPAAGRRSTS